MTGGFGGSMGGAGGLGQGKRPIQVKFEIPYFTTSGIQVRYLKIIEPKVSYSSISLTSYDSHARWSHVFGRSIFFMLPVLCVSCGRKFICVTVNLCRLWEERLFWGNFPSSELGEINCRGWDWSNFGVATRQPLERFFDRIS
jgi:hypothetical protein